MRKNQPGGFHTDFTGTFDIIFMIVTYIKNLFRLQLKLFRKLSKRSRVRLKSPRFFRAENNITKLFYTPDAAFLFRRKVREYRKFIAVILKLMDKLNNTPAGLNIYKIFFETLINYFFKTFNNTMLF